MPRFRFNVLNGINALDEEGVERPSLEVAKADAVTGARELVANLIRYGKPVRRTDRIEITNEAGILLDTVHFGDVIDLRSLGCRRVDSWAYKAVATIGQEGAW